MNDWPFFLLRALLTIILAAGIHHFLEWSWWISVVVALVVVYGGWLIIVDGDEV